MVQGEEGTQLLMQIRVQNCLCFYCLCNSGEANLSWFSSLHSGDYICLRVSGKLTGMAHPVPSIG